MSKRSKFYTIIGICFVCFFNANGAISKLDSLILEVDKVLEDKNIYAEKKKARMEEMRRKADSLPIGVEKFHALGDLMDEYNTYNTDSSYRILLQREQLAKLLGDSTLILNARMNRANLMNATAMYKEAEEAINAVKLENIPKYLHPYYFYIKRTLYGRLADFAAFPDEKKHYNLLTSQYRDSLLSINDHESLAYAITLADKLNSENRPEEAIEVVNNFISKNNLSEHDQAIFAWTLSDSYKISGDKDLRKKELMISSIADLKSGIKEYVSLRELASLLQEEGDLERAYRYMNAAMEDAAECNARQRIVELNTLYPLTNRIYIDKINSQKRALGWTIAVISILLLFLLALFFYTLRQMKKVSEARKTIHKAYSELDKLNSELQKANNNLLEANRSITENSKLKEVYIGKYMDQCLVYIDKLDSFRKSAVKMLNQNKTDDLKKIVKSSSGINDELKNFYIQFDRTFLSLFPTFVKDVNLLLRPEETLIPKHDGELTPELRILALIRLGINDSVQIASFLRYSLTTIYNYRTRIRNKAKGDRDLLEDEIKNLGK